MDSDGLDKLVEREMESRKRRKTGEGDRPAPFVGIEKNIYVGEARAFLRRGLDNEDEGDDAELAVCCCVKVGSFICPSKGSSWLSRELFSLSLQGPE